ncbi:hypothetical protein [Glaesserella sp.]
MEYEYKGSEEEGLGSRYFSSNKVSQATCPFLIGLWHQYTTAV